MFSDFLHNVTFYFFKTKFKIRQMTLTLVFYDSKELITNCKRK